MTPEVSRSHASTQFNGDHCWFAPLWCRSYLLNCRGNDRTNKKQSSQFSVSISSAGTYHCTSRVTFYKLKIKAEVCLFCASHHPQPFCHLLFKFCNSEGGKQPQFYVLSSHCLYRFAFVQIKRIIAWKSIVFFPLILSIPSAIEGPFFYTKTTITKIIFSFSERNERLALQQHVFSSFLVNYNWLKPCNS